MVRNKLFVKYRTIKLPYLMKNKYIMIILITLGMSYSFYKVHIAYQWIDQKAEDDYPPGVIDQILLPTSICTHNTGIYLAKCTSKKDIIPVEDAYPGDIGYVLLGNLITSFKGSILTKADFVKIHIWLNWTGLMLLVFALMAANLKWTATLIILIGSFLIKEENWPDYHSSIFGIFCIVLVATIFFALSYQKNYNKYFLSRNMLLFFSFLSLTAALLLREPIGYIGMASILFILIINFITEKEKWNNRNLIKCGTLVLIIISLNFVTASLLFIRNMTWNIPEAKGHPKHALSHSLVIGLGNPDTPNQWGITRSDVTGIYLANNIKKGVIYASKEYYEILWKAYLNIIVAQPFDIFHIYWKTALNTLAYPTNLVSNYLYIAILLFLMIIVLRYLKYRYNVIFRIVSGMGIASILTLMQGIFSHPFFGSVSEIGFIACILALIEMYVVIKRRKIISDVY